MTSRDGLRVISKSDKGITGAGEREGLFSLRYRLPGIGFVIEAQSSWRACETIVGNCILRGLIYLDTGLVHVEAGLLVMYAYCSAESVRTLPVGEAIRILHRVNKSNVTTWKRGYRIQITTQHLKDS
jgi:hypothetical protein